MAASRFLSAGHPARESDFSLFSVSNPPSPIVSPKGVIHVLGYTPKEGERGVPITVRIHFRCDLPQPIYVRLLVGHKPVPTKVREVSGSVYGRWQLDAAAPSHDEENSFTKVLLSVQALNDDGAVVDAVTFGEFSYWAPSCSPRTYECAIQGVKGLNQKSYPRRRLTSEGQHRSTTTPDRTESQKPVQQQVRLLRRMKTQSLMRTKTGAAGELGEELYAQTPVLELVTNLTSLCVGWTPAEVQAGRRLVRFGKVQDGRRLIVSCESISQDEYCEQDSVISCIYREDSEMCFVTSVDVIYLLERLTNGEFPVEEKNRIRRNLEGLRPITVSKHKPGFEDFFQRIMEFPDPKPRNIEKDLKVFKWNLLGQALEKILSKYSMYIAAVAEPADSVPPDTSLSEISDPVVHHLPYSPADSLEQVYRETNVVMKTESMTDDGQFTSEETDTQGSILEGNPGSSQLAYPIYDADINTIRTVEPETPGVWCADYKVGTIGTDSYGVMGYDMEQITSPGNFGDGTGYEIASYDLAFPDISNSISECYM